MGKLAVFGVAAAFAVAYDVFLVWLAMEGKENTGLGFFVLGGLAAFFLLVMWFIPLAQGKLESTFFDRAAATLIVLHTLAVFLIFIWRGPVGEALHMAFLTILFVVGVPVAFMLVLGLLLGRDRFEDSVYVGYLPPPRREPEPPKLHVEIERRRYTIERGKDRR